MKLRNVAAAAVLLTPVMFVGVTENSVASTRHRVVVTGTMMVYNGGGIFASSERRDFSINRTAFVSHSSTSNSIRVEGCAGGETRGILDVSFRLRASENVRYTPTLRLYEESSCHNLDLDGTLTGVTREVVEGGSHGRTMTVKNHGVGATDTVKVTINVANN